MQLMKIFRDSFVNIFKIKRYRENFRPALLYLNKTKKLHLKFKYKKISALWNQSDILFLVCSSLAKFRDF